MYTFDSPEQHSAIFVWISKFFLEEKAKEMCGTERRDNGEGLVQILGRGTPGVGLKLRSSACRKRWTMELFGFPPSPILRQKSFSPHNA